MRQPEVERHMRRTGAGETAMRDNGMPVLLETTQPIQAEQLCSTLGLQFLELNMNLPEYQAGRIDVPYFRSLAERYGIYCTLHLDENLDISDFNPHADAGYCQTVRESWTCPTASPWQKHTAAALCWRPKL